MAVGKFKLVDGEKVRLTRIPKEAGVVIEAGDMITISSGYAIKAVAASTAIAWCPDGGASADLYVDATIGNDFTLKTTGDAVFAITYRGGTYGINDTTQYVDYGDDNNTDVVKVDVSENAGTVGTAAGVVIRINKPIW